MITVQFIPWWPENPYQVLLRDELMKQDVRVLRNPPLSLLRLLAGRDGVDVLHIHWPHAMYLGNYLRLPYAILALALYRLFKNNLVWTVHELDFYETKRAVVDRFMVRLLMRWCRALIVHSEQSAREVRERFGFRGRVQVAYHPSYLGCYPNSVDRATARTKLGLAPAQRVFLYLGQVKPYKGVEDLIAAFASVSDSNAALLIAGKPLDAETAERIRALAAADARIKLDLRYVADDEMQLYFNAADLAVFPFRKTHTSGSLMLALGFGKPVIAPAIASIPEYVDQSMALLFDPAQDDDLGRALRAAESCDLALMASAALHRAQELNWTDMATRHAEVYREIAGQDV
jgi:beta-1,4-mannosyltransferase